MVRKLFLLRISQKDLTNLTIWPLSPVFIRVRDSEVGSANPHKHWAKHQLVRLGAEAMSLHVETAPLHTVT